MSVPWFCNGQDRVGYVSFLLVMHANQVDKRTIEQNKTKNTLKTINKTQHQS